MSHQYNFSELEAHELAELMQSMQTSTLLIDVRSPDEVSRGAIPGARNIPLHMLPLVEHELEDRHTIVFYCHSGQRSAQACAYMSGRGRKRVANLRGGILAWARSGQPVGQVPS